MRPSLRPTYQPLSRSLYRPGLLHPQQIHTQTQCCLRQAQIPARYARTTFDTLDARLQPKAFEQCREYARTGHCQGKGGLLLLGPPGTGKTSLAVAILRQVVQQNRGCCGVRFWNVPQGLEQLRQSFNRSQGQPPSVLDLSGHLLLVLDDLGKQKMSPWVAEQLYTLLDTLWNEDRPVVITTNLWPRQFVTTLAPALVSRILGLCHEVRLEGKDQRLRR